MGDNVRFNAGLNRNEFKYAKLTFFIFKYIALADSFSRKLLRNIRNVLELYC